MPKIVETSVYITAYKELILRFPVLEPLVRQRVKWFIKNPNDTRLSNHALTKNMLGKWAFSITDDVRIVYKWTNKNTTQFLNVGPHIKVYPKAKKKSPKR